MAESQLVQCSLYGADPYWGRIVSELGSAGAAFDIDKVSVAYDGVVGVPGRRGRRRTAARCSSRGTTWRSPATSGLGDGTAVMTFTDRRPEYIAENMRTS